MRQRNTPAPGQDPQSSQLCVGVGRDSGVTQSGQRSSCAGQGPVGAAVAVLSGSSFPRNPLGATLGIPGNTVLGATALHLETARPRAEPQPRRSQGRGTGPRLRAGTPGSPDVGRWRDRPRKCPLPQGRGRRPAPRSQPLRADTAGALRGAACASSSRTNKGLYCKELSEPFLRGGERRGTLRADVGTARPCSKAPRCPALRSAQGRLHRAGGRGAGSSRDSGDSSRDSRWQCCLGAGSSFRLQLAEEGLNAMRFLSLTHTHKLKKYGT